MRTSLAVLVFAVAVISSLAVPGPVHAVVEPKNELPADVLKALTEGTNFTVMSVDPDGIQAVPAYAWKILAHQRFDKDDAGRQKVVAAFKKSVDEGSLMAECFIPHHAISADFKSHKYVLVICFKCLQAIVYVDGAERQTVAISGSAENVLDKALAAATPEG